MSILPERFAWAKELVGPQPGEWIMEIGCGAGILAEQLGLALRTGKIVALDQSAAMARLATKRNQALVDSGRMEIVCSDFLHADTGKKKFDRIVAFNVNFFQKGSTKELLRVKALLNPGGKVFVFYQAPYEIGPEAAAPIERALVQNGLGPVQTVFKKLSPASAVCVVGGI